MSLSTASFASLSERPVSCRRNLIASIRRPYAAAFRTRSENFIGVRRRRPLRNQQRQTEDRQQDKRARRVHYASTIFDRFRHRAAEHAWLVGLEVDAVEVGAADELRRRRRSPTPPALRDLRRSARRSRATSPRAPRNMLGEAASAWRPAAARPAARAAARRSGPTGSALRQSRRAVRRPARSRPAETLKRAFMSLQPSAMMTRSSGAWLRRQGGR